jgi:hypothetical protein
MARSTKPKRDIRGRSLTAPSSPEPQSATAERKLFQLGELSCASAPSSESQLRSGEQMQRQNSLLEPKPENGAGPQQGQAHPTIAYLAKRWAAEQSRGVDWEDIALELVIALERDEFDECYTLEGLKLELFDFWFRQFASKPAGKLSTREGRVSIAGQIRLPAAALARRFERADLGSVAPSLNLSRPKFFEQHASSERGRTTVSAARNCQLWLESEMRAHTKPERNKAGLLCSGREGPLFDQRASI